MSDFTLSSLAGIARAIGRGAIFYYSYQGQAWDATRDLTLTHLGDTEGDQSVAFNEKAVYLEAAEVSGASKLDAWIEGADPKLTAGIVLADPGKRALVSPTGKASGGYSRRQRPVYYTILLFPEELFRDPVTGKYDMTLSYTSVGAVGTWKLNAAAITGDKLRLLQQGLILWRGHWMRAPYTMKHDDAGKAVESCEFQVMVNPALPEGHMLWTQIAELATSGINLEPVTTP